ncbi:MAG: hypothetical protein R3E12_00090 [Candidatus Eisenbacteria bacterium]|uniref:Uncharacterized protein n=1 Tax=Eiseniibacteriota bacterium TaxID=2212470 RepID=A0A956LY15_UNCEI|nr:hypothetical protein [Candidatus Eisenbacteria bacterium]
MLHPDPATQAVTGGSAGIGRLDAIRIASAGFWGPVTAARALRRLLVLASGFLALIVVLSVLNILSRGELRDLRELTVVPGIPLAAALLSEMALRDGITQRTLLYALLGPAPRTVLAGTRTVLTAVLLAVGSATLLTVFHLLLRASFASWAQDMLAAAVGSLAYVALFGVLHLLTKRGLIASLALFATFDWAIGMLPFSIRLLSPSYHLRVLGKAPHAFPIPVFTEAAKSNPFLATVVLVLVAAIAIYMTGRLFARKNLPELC